MNKLFISSLTLLMILILVGCTSNEDTGFIYDNTIVAEDNNSQNSPIDNTVNNDSNKQEEIKETLTLSSATIENGNLILIMSDGTKINAGKVQGEQGPIGPQGEKGEKGDKGDKGDTGSGSSSPDNLTLGNFQSGVITNSVSSSSTDLQLPTAKSVFNVLDNKQDKLTAGSNISIVDNVISASGSIGSDWTNVANKPFNTIGSGLKVESNVLKTDITLPTKLSDLTNDSNYVIDANYVHTDNNYSNDEKTSLSNKLDKNLGTTNAGKYLKVSSDGSIITSDISSIAIADNLTTDDATKALSAKQGKVLKDNTYSKDEVDDLIDAVINKIYPVGSLYFSLDSNFDPNDSIGGSWELVDEGYFVEATEDDDKVGTTIDAGLPNITGGLGAKIWGDSNGVGIYEWTSGPFKVDSGNVVNKIINAGGLANESASKYVQFNASWANNIYGNSSTVQPKSILAFIWKRVS